MENVPRMNLDSSTSYHVAGGSCNLERLILKTACQQCFAQWLCNLSGQNVFCIVGLWFPSERGPLWALTTLGEPSKTIITLPSSWLNWLKKEPFPQPWEGQLVMQYWFGFGIYSAIVNRAITQLCGWHGATCHPGTWNMRCYLSNGSQVFCPFF